MKSKTQIIQLIDTVYREIGEHVEIKRGEHLVAQFDDAMAIITRKRVGYNIQILRGKPIRIFHKIIED